MEAVLGALFALILVIGIILAMYWLLKHLPAAGRFSTGNYLKIIDRVMLSNDQSLLIVAIKGQFYFVGSSSQGITLLEKLEGDFEVPQPVELSFRQLLAKSKKDSI